MSEAPIGSVDVAIIGGGIMGCATAWHLAARGQKVALFERSEIAAEQSSRAWGFIRQQGRHEAEVPISAEANGLSVELTKQYGADSTGFTPGGILVPAETAEDEDRIADALAVARRMGLGTQMLDSAGIRALLPELAGQWRAGLYTPGDAHGEPALSTRTIATAAREAGATIYERCPVLGIETQGGRIAGVITARGLCQAAAVVIAGGIGTPVLTRRLGVDPPIQVTRSSVAQTVATKPFTRVAMWGPTVAYRPRADGSFVLGNGYRGVGMDYDLTIDSFKHLRHFLPAYRRNWRLLRLNLGAESFQRVRAWFGKDAALRALPEPRVNEKKVAHNAAAFRALFPHVGALGLARTWAGRIDLTPDAIPIIDQPSAVPGLFLAAGFSGHGFALGPSVGKQIAEWIVDGRPSLDLSAFRLSRFDEGAVKTTNKAL
jgi:glycine/D-amino acid oxidase-like deaminating enzyme